MDLGPKFQPRDPDPQNAFLTRLKVPYLVKIDVIGNRNVYQYLEKYPESSFKVTRLDPPDDNHEYNGLKFNRKTNPLTDLGTLNRIEKARRELDREELIRRLFTHTKCLCKNPTELPFIFHDFVYDVCKEYTIEYY